MADFLLRPVTSPIRLDGFAPMEVARRLRHLEGLVFFDTAGNFPSGAARPISVIVASPIRVLRGNVRVAEDREILRSATAAGPKLSGDQGFPVGGLCGWID